MADNVIIMLGVRTPVFRDLLIFSQVQGGKCGKCGIDILEAKRNYPWTPTDLMGEGGRGLPKQRNRSSGRAEN